VSHPAVARVAAIDCGTNSLRLLVADVDRQAGRLADVDRRMEIVRLGQGVDATGRLSQEALSRTLHALRGYARIIVETAAGAVRMVATSAARDAANAADFVRGVSEVLGLEPEVLSGQEEAYLSFTGATAELAKRPDARYLVVDIGGGSTEFVLGGGGSGNGGGDGGGNAGAGAGKLPGGAGITAASVDVGCVRLTERHLHGDPPAAAEIAAAAADIDAALDVVAAAMPAAEAHTLVGLAGSVTTVAALALRLPGYDAGLIHHSRIRAEEVSEQTSRLLRQTRAQRAALGVMHPGRADVIGGGALILDRLMQRFGFAEVLVSEHDILDGIAWALAGR
jgi:exopolyphosphatase/guanosine-5'-triphosphate,3'-diphosphate pyrophosphatase